MNPINSILFYGVVTLFFVIGEVAAQHPYCGTKPTNQERTAYLSQLKKLRFQQQSRRSFESNTFKIIMYRLRNTDGSGARSDAEFAEEINVLNGYFTPHGSCFSLTKIVNVDRSDIVQMDWQNNFDLSISAFASQFPPFNDAITIYVLPVATSISTKGKAFGIPASAFTMVSEEGWWNTYLSAHEMGHCLGLFHTFETAGNSSIELVTRDLAASCINGQGAWQDCNVGGDALCDTPADFGFAFNGTYVDSATCQYTFDSTDCHGNFYEPDATNIMSYTPYNCGTTFSGQQVNKMNLTIDLSLIFNNTQAPDDFLFGDAIYSSSYAHFMAKDSIIISPGNQYSVEGSAQVIHEVERHIDLKPGFTAAPTSVQGYFRARAKNLCENDTLLTYELN